MERLFLSNHTTTMITTTIPHITTTPTMHAIATMTLVVVESSALPPVVPCSAMTQSPLDNVNPSSHFVHSPVFESQVVQFKHITQLPLPVVLNHPESHGMHDPVTTPCPVEQRLQCPFAAVLVHLVHDPGLVSSSYPIEQFPHFPVIKLHAKHPFSHDWHCAKPLLNEPLEHATHPNPEIPNPPGHCLQIPVVVLQILHGLVQC